MFKGFHIAASGMAAQRHRVNLVGSNLANVSTTRTEEGGPYQRKEVVFRTSMPEVDLDALGLTVELLGLKMAEQLGFTAQVAAELGYGAGQHVVVVVSVDPAGPAAIKGIQVSDVITEIDDEPIKSVDAFFRSISHLETDKSALFWLWRPDRGIDVRALKIAGQG